NCAAVTVDVGKKFLKINAAYQRSTGTHTVFYARTESPGKRETFYFFFYLQFFNFSRPKISGVFTDRAARLRAKTKSEYRNFSKITHVAKFARAHFQTYRNFNVLKVVFQIDSRSQRIYADAFVRLRPIIARKVIFQRAAGIKGKAYAACDSIIFAEIIFAQRAQFQAQIRPVRVYVRNVGLHPRKARTHLEAETKIVLRLCGKAGKTNCDN